MATPWTFYSIYDIKIWRNPHPPNPQKKISIGKKILSHEQEKFLIQ
jgi:hypothetical protein